MDVESDWVAYRCACGFKLQRVPKDVVAQLPRCLGCGRSLRAPVATVRTRALTSVRDLR